MAEGSPINIIKNMKQQGMSNNKIIQNLTRQGYSNSDIFDAMNHLDTKNAVESSPANLSPHPGNLQNNFSQPPPSFNNNNTNNNYANGQIEHYDPKTEELIETIIDEKWQDLLKDVNKIIEWKNRSERRIQEVELQIKNLKQSFDDLHKAVIGKVSEYDKHILDVGTEIKAMEKVFSKVLPTFTENVHELSRITKKAKEQQE